MKHSNSPLDALERLNVVLGGRDDDAVNITEAIDQIADAIEAGGGGGGATVVIDKTLTKSDQAADSKIVGDRLLVLQNAVGSPKVANTANEMTDIDNVYVYTGSEAGYTAGHWYYYDNLMWHDGGVYNAIAVATDVTLSVPGQAADAAAVGNLRTDLKYVPISITGFSFEPVTAEIGSTVTSVVVTYQINKLPTSMMIMGNYVTPAASGTETISGLSISDTYEVTMNAVDSGSYSKLPTAAVRLGTLEFVNRLYYGVKAAGTLNEAYVKSLANKPLAASKSGSITVNSTSNTYIWYAYPARLGTSVFKIGGIEGGFEPAETVSVTNNSGYTEDYYVYRSTEKTLGLTTVEIS